MTVLKYCSGLVGRSPSSPSKSYGNLEKSQPLWVYLFNCKMRIWTRYYIILIKLRGISSNVFLVISTRFCVCVCGSCFVFSLSVFWWGAWLGGI